MKVKEDDMNDMLNKGVEIYNNSIGKAMPLPENILKAILMTGILAGLKHATGEPTQFEMNTRRKGRKALDEEVMNCIFNEKGGNA